MIVTKLTEYFPTAKLEGEVIEPAFFIAGKGSVDCSSDIISAHLSHKVTRNKKDLRSHSERIYLFIKHRDAVALYGALVDLFLVLGSSGIALRKRVLLNARFLLSNHELHILRQSLLLGLTTEVGLPSAGQALLTHGLTSVNRQFIQKHNAGTGTEMSLIEEAMSYIEYGQLEQAQSILQGAIVDNPSQLELHDSLLEILQKTGDKEQFSSSYRRLLGHAIILPPQWQEMAQKFGLEEVEA